MRSFWVNRTVCDVLEDMRKCYESHNYAPLKGLIEEVQVKANRMEAALGDQKDLKSMEDEWHKKKKELKELQREIDKLKEIAGKNEDKDKNDD